jgi:cytochrome c-type biogenesis protein CcmH
VHCGSVRNAIEVPACAGMTVEGAGKAARTGKSLRRILQPARRLLAALILLLALPAVAVEPDERLGDPALEARARALSEELRCLVCQNESIDSSNAPLARDLRVLVRERLEAGDSDDQVLAYVTDRYGDFVLLRPPVQPNTYALWFGPAAVLLLGIVGMGVYLAARRPARAEPDPLTPEERRRVDALLDRGDPPGPGRKETP